jgi:hypothetical protein
MCLIRHLLEIEAGRNPALKPQIEAAKAELRAAHLIAE